MYLNPRLGFDVGLEAFGTVVEGCEIDFVMVVDMVADLEVDIRVG